MKENSTGIFFDGNSVGWARAEKSREGVVMSSSGSFGDVPLASAFPEPANYETALHAFSHKLNAKLPDAATYAIPTSDVIFRCSRFPATDLDEIAVMSANQIEKDSPLPIEEMVSAFEILASDDTSSIVLTASAPVEAVEKIRSFTGADPAQVERVDASALGLLRNLVEAKAVSGNMREAVIAEEGDRLTLIVTDSAKPVLIRSVGMAASSRQGDLLNATKIALIQTQMDHGASALTRLVAVSDSVNIRTAVKSVAGALGCPMHCESPKSLPPIAYGVALRTLSESAFNMFPARWNEMLSERKFRKRFSMGLMIAAGLWLVMAGWFYGWPLILDQRIKALNEDVERLLPAETKVNDIRTRIKIIEQYSDRTFSPMEALLEVANSQPLGIDMSSFRYNGVKHQISVEGRAKTSMLVYDFMDNLKTRKLFREIKLVSGPTLNKSLGINVFELSIEFKTPEDPEAQPK